MTPSTKYAVVAFLDTNIILEGRPLDQLPWAEIDAAGPILAVVTPTSLREIDRKKRDGRLGERARAFNRMIAPAATEGQLVAVCTSAPLVDLTVATCGPLDWESYEFLERDDPDARIVAEALAAEQGDAENKMLVSQDLNPISLARRANLKIKHVSAEWLMPKEPGPADREISKLQQRIRELSVNEPSLTISVTGPTEPVPVINVAPLPSAEAYTYQQALVGKKPRRQASWMSHQTDHSFDDRFQRFTDKTVPEFVAEFHRKLSASYAQVPISIRVRNSGSVRADRLVITVVATGGSIHDRFAVVPLNGPVVPEPRELLDSIRMRSFPTPPALIGKHDLHVETETHIGSTLLEIHCEDFRHDREWLWQGFATLDAATPSPMVIEVRVTAANLHGVVTQRIVMPKEIMSKTVAELVDLEAHRWKVRLPFPSELEDAIGAKDGSRFEIMDQVEPDD